MKDFILGLLAFVIGLGVLYLVINSKDVRASQYHSCIVTSTDKSICESLHD